MGQDSTNDPQTAAHQPVLVSVIIPTWNRASRVLVAINSVLAQTMAALELIVVDDGSVDATLGAVARRALVEGRLRLLSTANRGVSAARNAAIRRARGQWIAFLDSDDRWLPEKLTRQLEALRAHPEVQIAHCDEIWYRHGRRVNPKHIHAKQGGWIYASCLPRCAISPSAVIIHQQVFDRVGVFDESLPACEDYDLWLRICARMPVLYQPAQLLIKEGGHDDQLSRTVVALDRFRIRALTKILDSGVLRADDRDATLATLLGKIAVYRQGAERRGRLQEVALLDALKERIGNGPAPQLPGSSADQLEP